MKLVIKAIVAVIFGGVFYFVGSLVLGTLLDNRLIAQGIAGSLALVAALSAFFSNSASSGDGTSASGHTPTDSSHHTDFGGGDFGGGDGGSF